MPSNKEWLYSLDPHALTEWFDAEHVENQNGTLDGARAALDDENDSREKLEADVRAGFGELGFGVNRIMEWLDRQAAITDAEWVDELEQLHMGYKPIIAELQAQVDVLTYERDYYIGLCHRAVEAGEKFATLVDMNGEVLS